jgi:hypothetical protein
MKIKVTVPNGNYPLCHICGSMHEAYECVKSAAKTIHRKVDLDLVLDTLDGMKTCGFTDIEFHNGIQMEALSREGEQR